MTTLGHLLCRKKQVYLVRFPSFPTFKKMYTFSFRGTHSWKGRMRNRKAHFPLSGHLNEWQFLIAEICQQICNWLQSSIRSSAIWNYKFCVNGLIAQISWMAWRAKKNSTLINEIWGMNIFLPAFKQNSSRVAKSITHLSHPTTRKSTSFWMLKVCKVTSGLFWGPG